jgi:DHA1 family tetracycline resistance protein-like MFS transporter
VGLHLKFLGFVERINLAIKSSSLPAPTSIMRSGKPAIVFIFITLLIDVTGFGIIIPVLPSLISELTGEGMGKASQYGGWMLFAFSLMQFLFSPILGNLSDQYGRRPILLLSLLGFGLDYILLALAPNIAWLFLGRILAGITGASFTTAAAYIADVSTPESRGRNFGMIGAAFGLGFIIGPVLGGVLGAHFGARFPFIAAACLTLLNCLYGLLILPESLGKEHRRPFSWKRANPLGALKSLSHYPGILGLVVSLFFMHLASHAVQSTWSYFTMGEFRWNSDEVGYSLGFVGLLVAGVQAGLIRVANSRLGVVASVYWGLAFFAIGLLIFSFANHSWILYAGLIPYCLSGIGGPSMQGLISGQVPPNAQGELQGALTGVVSLAAIFGPPLMTEMYGRFSNPEAPVHFPGAAFLVGAVFASVSLWIAWKNLSKNAS